MRTVEETVKIRTAPAWRPAPGDLLTGFVVATRRGETRYGVYPILVLDVEGEYVSVHAFHSILKDALADLHAEGDLTPGSEITIAYVGKQPAKDDPEREYHLYVVFPGSQPPAEDDGADLFDRNEN